MCRPHQRALGFGEKHQAIIRHERWGDLAPDSPPRCRGEQAAARNLGLAWLVRAASVRRDSRDVSTVEDVGPYICAELGQDALGTARASPAARRRRPLDVRGRRRRADRRGRGRLAPARRPGPRGHRPQQQLRGAHPRARPSRVVAAATRAVRAGASFGLPNDSELRHARALVARLPGVEQVRYTNSGTEAVMTALRVARAHTGRDACAFVHRAYHGTSDPALATGGRARSAACPPVSLGDIVTLPINDPQALADTLDGRARAFAALRARLPPQPRGADPLDTGLRRPGGRALPRARDPADRRRGHQPAAAAARARRRLWRRSPTWWCSAS